MDGLGRTIKTQTKDSQGDVFTETQYDQYGRLWKVSNPYRQGETKYWTETKYDEAGRVKEIISPDNTPNNPDDNARVTTAYGLATSGSAIGATVTVEDQANKQRRSVTDSLGRLVRVDEPDSNGNLGTVANPVQPTFYTYDILGNLKTVTQGEQTRTFVYDSLSRLLSATNPEGGTISYEYDSNSNLKRKTDARGIRTNFDYDALNRVVRRWYEVTTTPAPPNYVATPDVDYFYDGTGLSQVPTYSKGKLTKVSSSVSSTEYTGFDSLGRLLSSNQITDNQTYTTSYAYNLVGAMISETYPSGRVVTNSFDNDGQLTNVSSARAGQTPRTYANAFVYAASGAIQSMRLGNGRFESTVFNSRLQPTQIALGTSASNTSLLKLNYDYGTQLNNGNVLQQTITVPTVGTTPGFTATQNYTYDELNRLKQATETISNQTSWRQTYSFDRYGNRRFDLSQTTTPDSQSNQNITNPQIDTSNNRFLQNQGYFYDAAGNLTQDASGKRFFYDAENKQTKFYQSGNQNDNNPDAVYSYDGGGQRIKKVVGNETTVFVYDGSGKMVAEYTINAPANTNPHTSYLTGDMLGSPRILTNASGNVISRRDFLPFGEEIIGLGQRSAELGYNPDNVKQKYTSKERDDETSLDYFGARYYSSTYGRFTSVDQGTPEPLDPQSWHRYRYARNNPLYYVDPDGNKDEPAKDKRINEALATDRRLLEAIRKSNNFSQRQFEIALERGTLKKGNTDYWKLMGAAGEAIIADQRSRHPLSLAVTIQPKILQGVSPDIFDLVDTGRFKSGKGEIIVNMILTDVVQANGQTADVSLSETIRYNLVEVKSGFSPRYIPNGANQVAATATALRAAGLPGVASLVVDKGAWERLKPEDRTRIYNQVTQAGGYIQVVEGLAMEADQRRVALRTALAPDAD
jgi:RHS repeat-associated protein